MICFADAARLFLTAKQAARRSPRTIQWYEDQFQHFENWLEGANLTDDIEQLTPFDIDRYLAMEAQGISDSSLHARYRALRSLYNWLHRRNVIATNPMTGVEEPHRREKPVDHVTFEEFTHFVASIRGERWVDYRDRAVACVLFWSGLRVSELCDLRLPDIDTGSKLITVRNGKGGKARLVPLAPDGLRELTAYLYTRPDWNGMELWLSNDGYGGCRGVLTVVGVQQMLKRRCVEAGLRNLHPHLWRHGFGTTMLNAGADKAWVQKVLGHSDSKTTDRYARWLATGIQRQFNEAHSRIITHNA